jgi:HD-GYP domain-containing protein (c-di-GMP phosphodiesterase class II)
MTVVEVKIPVTKLKQGMFVCRLDKEWSESSFVFQGFLINNEQLIEQLQKECSYVYIDENRGIAAKRSLHEISSKNKVQKDKSKSQDSFLNKLLRRKNTQPKRTNTYILRDIVNSNIEADEISPPPKLVAFDEEMPTAKQAHATASALVKDFMTHIKRGGAVDMIVAKHTVENCISSILRSPDAMMLLMRLKTKDYSLWQHSMNVSVLAISLGRYLNLHDDELILLGLSGMFHDIGKLSITKEALEAAKTKQELKEILDSHTTLGQKILVDSMGQLADVASQVAYCHHEHLDGSGYPRGLKGAQISSYTRMISILNVYDNLTTGRPGKKALTHYEAMTVLLENAGKHFDATLVNSFNRSIGTYPVGCIVEMNSGEIALVVEENDNQRLRPKIMLLTNSEKEQIPKKVVNLAELEFLNEADSYFIKNIVDPKAYGINSLSF